jgi:hypothetical protein
MKDKEIIKATLLELNINTPVEGTNASINSLSNNSNNNSVENKENFFKAAGDAMAAYVSAVKEQNDYRTIKLLPSPDKRAIAKMKAQVILEQLELEKTIIQNKKRKLLQENKKYIEESNSDDDENNIIDNYEHDNN